jgi:hypothetical protein
MKVKCFDNKNIKQLEDTVNNFISNLHSYNEIIDINYKTTQVSETVFERTNLVALHSVLIKYK